MNGCEFDITSQIIVSPNLNVQGNKRHKDFALS